MSKPKLMKTLVVNRNSDQAKSILIENCERREVGPYSDTDTALLIDLTDSLTFHLYWRYRRPKAYDKLQIREVIPSECYICDEHAVISFEDAGNGSTLIKIYKSVEISRKFVRNLFGFLIMPLMVIGLNWEFFASLFPLHLSAMPQLIVWIFVLIFLEWFVWMTGLVPAEQRGIDAYKCIENSLCHLFNDFIIKHM